MKQNVKSYIDLEELAGGAFAEKFNEALMQVAENIQNQNTDATTKRGITVNIKFAPNKSRTMVATSISVTTKLAATEAIDTQMVMGLNMRTGQIEIAEYDGQIRGQTTISELEQRITEEPAAEPAPEPVLVQQPDGKPLDLRNRGRKLEADLVPGLDYDPDTGEMYATAGRPADDRKTTAGQVVPISAMKA